MNSSKNKGPDAQKIQELQENLNKLTVACILTSEDTSFEDACRQCKVDLPAVRNQIDAFICQSNMHQGNCLPLGPQYGIPTALLDYILPDGIDTDDGYGTICEEFARLRQCIMAIPDFKSYSALMHSVTGKTPNKPRDGRPEDAEQLHASTEIPDVNKAIAFLRTPQRLKYIKSGDTPFAACLNYSAIESLKQHHIYIPEDLARFSAEEILGFIGIPAHIFSDM